MTTQVKQAILKNPDKMDQRKAQAFIDKMIAKNLPWLKEMADK